MFSCLSFSKAEGQNLMSLRFAILLSAALVQGACRASPPPAEVADTIWEAIKVFEGAANTVSSDFDCQGMSIGVAQWNIGKSFMSVKAIVTSVPLARRSGLMPTHGQLFEQALAAGQAATMTFVRSLQTIADPKSCDANKRLARWNKDGRVFVLELGQVLSLPESVAAQRQLRSGIFMDGNSNAVRWAKALRGPASAPTLKEIAYFVDMQNFNGGGLQKFQLPYAGLDATARTACVADAIAYLRTADEPFLLHKKAARKNATLLQPALLSDSELVLFCNAYKVAVMLNKSYSRQFRLTTINRRAAILFGAAYYGDMDAHPIQIRFPPP